MHSIDNSVEPRYIERFAQTLPGRIMFMNTARVTGPENEDPVS